MPIPVEATQGGRVEQPGLRFESFGVSHEGRVRELNEDRYLVEPRSGIWLVADGMGGHDAGEVASAAIVAHAATIGIASSAPDLRARFEERILRANEEIRAIARDRGGTIGSTFAALLAYERDYACVWCGDSRVYRIHAGAIAQVTRDHTEVQELLDAGTITPEEALTWPRRNVITRAVGVSDEVVAEIEIGRAEPGDVFVLGSDGLHGHVTGEEILEKAADATPEAACHALLALVLDRGATDNVTVVVVRCHAAPPAGDRSFRRPRDEDVTHVL